MRNGLIALVLILLLSPAAVAQPGAKPLASMPFEFDGVHVAIKAAVADNNDSLLLLFDTGAEVNVLDNTFASQLKLDEKRQSGLSGFDKVMTNVPVVNINTLHLGILPLPAQQFYVDDLSSIIINGRHIQGIIGYPVLKNYIIKLDYQHKLLSVYKSGRFSYPKGGRLLKLKMNYYTPTVMAAINIGDEKIDGRYHVTTGGDYGLLFNAPFVENHRLSQRITISGTSSVKDMLKQITYTNCTVPLFSIGGFNLNNISASYSPDVNDNSPDNDIAGAIGCDVWKHFILYLNYNDKELYLEDY